MINYIIYLGLAISTQEDVEILDFNYWIGHGLKKWQMSFNPTKCIHLKTSIDYFLFQLHTSWVWPYYSEITHLGVTIDYNVNWKEHNEFVTKANSVNAFLKQNLSGCSIKVKKNRYLAMVQPIIEYAAIICSLHAHCDVSTGWKWYSPEL